MGIKRKKTTPGTRQAGTNDGMNNVKTKGENFYRSAKQVKHLHMRQDGKPQRNASGDIIKAAAYQSRDIPRARVEPNRKWFGNTRVISQDSLNAFRNAMAKKSSDPYQMLLHSNKLPLSLLEEKSTVDKVHRGVQAWANTFGPKAQRKRVKLDAENFEGLAENAKESGDSHGENIDQAFVPEESDISSATEPIFSKGQSNRIWSELYKVIDSSDVVLHVLDARDPLGTRCTSIEKHLAEEAPHKHLVFILNKVDLVPSGVAAKWVRLLSKERPTLAMHSSITNSFGKGNLIALLRQFASLHSNRKEISVGFVGYPNVGKSSIINTLQKKKVASAGPIPGQTKVWQYISLTKRIYLIDCPGIVPASQEGTPENLLLRGAIRVENVDNPEQYIPGLLSRVKRHHMERTYNVEAWESHEDFLERIARKSGRLLRQGEPDVDAVAKMILNDFMRGKIPWFNPCPDDPATTDPGEEC